MSTPYSEWRVIQMRDSDGVPYFTIEDTITRRYPGHHPFVEHVPAYPTALSVKELKMKLQEMVAAVGKPVLVYQEARIEEKLTEQKRSKQ